MISRKLFIVLLAVFVFIASCNAQRPSSCEDVDCPTGYRCTENPRPRCERIGCTKEWNPVCGVNGVTYFNLCELSAAGVELAYPGQCRIELDDPVDDVHFVDDNNNDFNNIDGEEYVVEDAIEDDPAVEYDELPTDEEYFVVEAADEEIAPQYEEVPEEYFEPEIAEEFFEEAAEEVYDKLSAEENFELAEEYFVEAANEEIAPHYEEVPDEYFEPEIAEEFFEEAAEEVNGEFPTEEYFVEAAEEEIALHFEEVPDEYFKSEIAEELIEEEIAPHYEEVSEEYFEPEIAEEPLFEEATEDAVDEELLVDHEYFENLTEFTDDDEEVYVEAGEVELAEEYFEEVNAEEPEEVYVELPLEESVDEVSGCPVFYAPVCAKNGDTYYNGCFFAFEGEEVDYDGECVLYVEDN